MQHYKEILTDLTHNASAYNFFQAVNWLEKLAQRQIIAKKICFIPTAELTFPATDINTLVIHDDGSKLYLNFMGLYGVDSPLPHYFLAKLLLENEMNVRIKNFLNIFTQRIYQLLYCAWQKYRVYTQLADDHALYLKYLIALSGNSLNNLDQEEFAFAGMLGARNKHCSSCSDILREYLNVPVDIKEFIPTWIKLDQECALGQTTVLGNNILLGNQTLDLTRKILIAIGPLSTKKITTILPDQQQGKKLINFIQRYLGSLIEFDLKFIIQTTGNFNLTLGSARINLGWNFFIGSSPIATYNFKINKCVYNFI